MSTLYFKNPSFNDGLNLTVRRGVKWDCADHDNVLIVDTGSLTILACVDIATRVFRFCDLTDRELANEHDPECRTAFGLFTVLRDVYPGFDDRELVTLVEFAFNHQEANDV